MKCQNDACYYCGHLMWTNAPETFATTHKITRKQAAKLQCTAEHLEARQDGGQDTAQNIVAACKFCNAKRHAGKTALPPQRYRQKVQNRLKQGRWHQLSARPKLASKK